MPRHDDYELPSWAIIESQRLLDETPPPYHKSRHFTPLQLTHQLIYYLRHLIRRHLYLALRLLSTILISWIILTPILNPSYTHPPKHYSGTNPHGEKVFIAACIVDPDLIRGSWGKAVLDLISIIGPENTYLSIYENDSGPETKKALKELSELVICKLLMKHSLSPYSLY